MGHWFRYLPHTGTNSRQGFPWAVPLLRSMQEKRARRLPVWKETPSASYPLHFQLLDWGTARRVVPLR